MAQWKGEIKTICIVFDPEMKFGEKIGGIQLVFNKKKCKKYSDCNDKNDHQDDHDDHGDDNNECVSPRSD